MNNFFSLDISNDDEFLFVEVLLNSGKFFIHKNVIKLYVFDDLLVVEYSSKSGGKLTKIYCIGGILSLEYLKSDLEDVNFIKSKNILFNRNFSILGFNCGDISSYIF